MSTPEPCGAPVPDDDLDPCVFSLALASRLAERLVPDEVGEGRCSEDGSERNRTIPNGPEQDRTETGRSGPFRNDTEQPGTVAGE